MKIIKHPSNQDKRRIQICCTLKSFCVSAPCKYTPALGHMYEKQRRDDSTALSGEEEEERGEERRTEGCDRKICFVLRDRSIENARHTANNCRRPDASAGIWKGLNCDYTRNDGREVESFAARIIERAHSGARDATRRDVQTSR